MDIARRSGSAGAIGAEQDEAHRRSGRGEFQHIVKITRYFKDISHQDAVNQVIHEYFGEHLPCSTTVQVAAFVVPTMLIEIDGWAVIPDGRA